MFLLGSSVSVPSPWSSYDMKTRLPISRKRSQRVQPGLQSSLPQPTSSLPSQDISESGPHGPGPPPPPTPLRPGDAPDPGPPGPGPPAEQKSSDEGSGTIRSGGIPTSCQSPIAS